MDYNNLTLIIPTLNEEKNIKDVLEIVDSSYPGISVIVADDRGNDNTHNLVMDYKSAILLDRSKEKFKGITASVMDAVELVNTDYFVVMGSDFQHPPEKIKDIYNSLLFHDIVIGTRTRGKNKCPLHKKLISWGGDALAHSRLVLKKFVCLDTMSGFFGINTKLFRSIMLKDGHKFEKKGYKILFDTLKYAPNDVNIAHVSYVSGI